MLWVVQALFLFMSVSAADEKRSEFGCQYEKDEYRVSPNGTNTNINTPLYGKEVKPMVFKDVESFRTFYNKIESVRQAVASEYIHNSVDSLTRYYDEFKKSGKDFTTFYREYDVPKKVDNLPLEDTFNVIRLYQRLLKDYAELKNHFMLGTCDDSASEDMLKTLALGIHQFAPPSDYEHDRLIGIIRFSVGGSLGYVLVDAEIKSAHTTTPIVMEDSKHELHKPNASRMAPGGGFGKIDYSFLGVDKAYIRMDCSVPQDQDENGTAIFTKTETHVLFITSSLCSFVQNIEKKFLLDTSRDVAKYSTDSLRIVSVELNKKLEKTGNLKEDYRLKAEIQPNVQFYTRSGKSGDYNHSFDAIKFDDNFLSKLSEPNRKLLTQYSTHFGWGENELYEKIKKMYNIWNDDQPFVKEMNYWYDNIVVSPSKDAVSRLWDWTVRKVKMG